MCGLADAFYAVNWSYFELFSNNNHNHFESCNIKFCFTYLCLDWNPSYYSMVLKIKRKIYMGATFSLVLGVSGVFVANGKVVNWHPITTCFSIVHCSVVNTFILSVPYSCFAIIVYLILSAFIYTAVYKK